MKSSDTKYLDFACKECGFKPEGSAPVGSMQWREYPTHCEKCGGWIVPKFKEKDDERQP